MLKIKHIFKSHQDKKIVNNVSLEVKPGEIVVLLGPSGVGKSTLLRILNNLESIDSGTIELDGNPLNLSSAQQHQTIGMVFQHFNLFEQHTVEQNITLALENVQHKSKHEALAIAHDLLTHYGLADKAKSMVTKLSGGQKQRLAIARTLALNPKIICFDEPTSALDPLATNHVAQSIQDLASQGYMILVATHDISLVEKISCTISLMSQGTIIETARSNDFFKQKQHYPRIASFINGTRDYY